jgi:hypothetical protein
MRDSSTGAGLLPRVAALRHSISLATTSEGLLALR